MKNLTLTLVLFLGLNAMAQKKLSNVALKNLQDQTLSTTKNFQEKDKIYVFSFWATWCTPCIQELDAINDVYEEWKKEINFEVIAVATDDARTQKRIRPLVNGKGWVYTVLLDTNQDFKRSLSITNVPYIVVVKNNEIVYVHNGHNPGGETELYNTLKSL